MKRIPALFFMSFILFGSSWGQVRTVEDTLIVMPSLQNDTSLIDSTLTDTISVDTSAAIARTWILTEDFTLREDHDLDTFKTGSQVYHPVFRNSISSSYLGNIGLPAKNNLLYQDQARSNYLFLKYFQPYLFTHENNVYYNVRKPYTLLGYMQSIGRKDKREEFFQAIHTQNINPFFNFGGQIRIRSAGGQYLNQKSKTVNFRGWLSYNTRNYSMHTSYNHNSFENQENGGLVNDSLFRAVSDDERTFDVNLEDAKSTLKNNDFQVTNRYRFGSEAEAGDTSSLTGMERIRERTAKTGSLIHTLRFERNYRLYEDEILPDAEQRFYQNFLNDSISTFDSTFYRSLSNTVHLMLDENPDRKKDFGARAWARHELVKYTFSKPVDPVFTEGGDTIADDHVDRQYNNISIGASLVHTVGTGWNWILRGHTYLSGYRIGDVDVSGEITRYFKGKEDPPGITLGGRFSLTQPDYYYQHFASNHFAWENDFRKVKEMLATLDYDNPGFGLNVRAYYSLLTDYIYVDTDFLPAQYDKALLLLGGIANQRMHFGPFHTVHTLAYQFASNRFVVRIPDIAYYTSNFLAFPIVRGVLTAEIGFDLYYNTSFSAYGFMPATGFFYNQDVRKLGNYPYLDVFVTARLKRVWAFFKVEHPYAQRIEKNYFHVLNYPMPGMSMKFGLTWSFYD